MMLIILLKGMAVNTESKHKSSENEKQVKANLVRDDLLRRAPASKPLRVHPGNGVFRSYTNKATTCAPTNLTAINALTMKHWDLFPSCANSRECRWMEPISFSVMKWKQWWTRGIWINSVARRVKKRKEWWMRNLPDVWTVCVAVKDDNVASRFTRGFQVCFPLFPSPFFLVSAILIGLYCVGIDD